MTSQVQGRKSEPSLSLPDIPQVDCTFWEGFDGSVRAAAEAQKLWQWD